MKNSKLLWYASYGSNLSEERFKYYIQGGWFEGKYYEPCWDPRKWRASRIHTYSGRMYFGGASMRWDRKGTAFYLPGAEGTVKMRLYLITEEQFEHVREWEGRVTYGNQLCLGEEDGIPVYTLTSFEPKKNNPPCGRYLKIIRNSLVQDCGMLKEEAEQYLNDCLQPLDI